MARIVGNSGASVFQIRKFLGLNENEDGDTRLAMGEAAESRNWRVTAGGSLQIRPGTRTLCAFTSPVRGLWSGNVAGADVLVCAADGQLWKLELEGVPTEATRRSLGSLTDAPTEFFGYGEKLYILNGVEYKVWDGETLSDVEGYCPLVSVSNTPTGGGTALEQVNKLTGARRARFSPDGEATVFQLPEKGLLRLDYVKDVATGATLEASGYAADMAAGTVTFTTAPEKGTNSLEIGWTMADSGRAQVCAMRFAEIFNGATDNRVFLYGDGTNRCIYSGLDGSGRPTAEYFPDLNELAAGEANTPITGLVRHFSRMLVFKTNATYAVSYDTITRADGAATAGFYVTPINRVIGSVAPGQCRLVLNNPRSLHSGSVYEWKSANGYLTADERQAKRISERIRSTLGSLDLQNAYVFDDEYSQEYYIVSGDLALVHNYTQDAWYIYTRFPAACMTRYAGELYMGTVDGRLSHISRQYRSDDGAPIDAFWRSGSISFERSWKRKYTSVIWVAMMPETGARVVVTARSNRKSTYPDKVLSYGLAAFEPVDFGHWSFGTNRQSQVRRVKLKVKKYTYYQLVFESNSSAGTATIVGTDIQVRYSGNVK